MPDEQVLRTSHPYINQLVPVRASAPLFTAELDELAQAGRSRDRQTATRLLFTAGMAHEAEQPAATNGNGNGNGKGPRPVATNGNGWHPSNGAGTEVDVSEAVTAGYPDGDADQVSA